MKRKSINSNPILKSPFTLISQKQQFIKIKDENYAPNQYFIELKKHKNVRKNSYINSSIEKQSKKNQHIKPKYGLVPQDQMIRKSPKSQKQISQFGYIRIKSSEQLPKRFTYELTQQDEIQLSNIQNYFLNKIKRAINFTEEDFKMAINYFQKISYMRNYIDRSKKQVITQLEKLDLFNQLNLEQRCSQYLDKQYYLQILHYIYLHWRKRKQNVKNQPLMRQYYPRSFKESKISPNIPSLYMPRGQYTIGKKAGIGIFMVQKIYKKSLLIRHNQIKQQIQYMINSQIQLQESFKRKGEFTELVSSFKFKQPQCVKNFQGTKNRRFLQLIQLDQKYDSQTDNNFSIFNEEKEKYNCQTYTNLDQTVCEESNQYKQQGQSKLRQIYEIVASRKTVNLPIKHIIRKKVKLNQD